MRRTGRLIISLSLASGSAAAALLLAPGEAHAAPCYIAYIHGSGEQHQDDTVHQGFDENGDPIEAEWTPDSNGNSFTYYSSKAYLGADGCTIYRVGYNGLSSWWDSGAAGLVASQINDFITQYNIPDNNLIIITHSMGGLVGRWILNNGVPNAPYYNYGGSDYARIAQKTKYMITMQAPHAGTQTADAIYGEADHYFSDAAGVLALWFGGQDRSDARSSLRRSYMADAANWMGDAGRDRTIYTIGGNSVDDDAGEGMSQDSDLQLAWAGVCYRRGAVNGEGALCGAACVVVPILGCIFNAATFSDTAGDGLVELTSADGQLTVGGGWRGPPVFMQGAYSKWLEIHDNHNQGRYDKHYASVTDYIGGTTQNNYPGSYIGAYGLNLPCSTVHCEARSGPGHF